MPDIGICAMGAKAGSGKLLDHRCLAVTGEAKPRAQAPVSRSERARKPDEGGLRAWVEGLLSKMSGREPHGTLPLDIRATAFQRRVWTYLQSIPFGATRSYVEVAKAIGQPTASRAVARACATNPVAVAIPCHRVVREDGNISGYRWGVERKKTLLEMEQRGV